MMSKEETGFRPLPPVKAPGQYPRTLCGDTKDATLSARPGNSTTGEEILNTPSGLLCEEASCYRGLEDLCARADATHIMSRESWGDMEAWLVKHLGLHALLPDTKHVPEDLKAKMAVRVNTQGV